MRTLFWVVLAVGLAAWAYTLRQRLLAAQQRGSMYHDISVRLDQRVAELEQRLG